MQLCVRAAILNENQNCLGGRGAGLLRESEKDRGTSLTSLQLAFMERVVPAIQVVDWSLDNKC